MDTTKVVLFSQPIWVAGDERKGIRKTTEIWGVRLPSFTTTTIIDDYITYLCGASKWQREGNSIQGNTWRDITTNRTYSFNDDFINRYLENTRKEMHISWAIVETNKDLKNGCKGIDDGFIISRKLYDTISEYGATLLLDVQVKKERVIK